MKLSRNQKRLSPRNEASKIGCETRRAHTRSLAFFGVGVREPRVGQIEVRRSYIEVVGAEGVIVPLWVELTKQ